MSRSSRKPRRSSESGNAEPLVRGLGARELERRELLGELTLEELAHFVAVALLELGRRGEGEAGGLLQLRDRAEHFAAVRTVVLDRGLLAAGAGEEREGREGLAQGAQGRRTPTSARGAQETGKSGHQRPESER